MPVKTASSVHARAVSLSAEITQRQWRIMNNDQHAAIRLEHVLMTLINKKIPFVLTGAHAIGGVDRRALGHSRYRHSRQKRSQPRSRGASSPASLPPSRATQSLRGCRLLCSRREEIGHRRYNSALCRHSGNAVGRYLGRRSWATVPNPSSRNGAG